MQGWSVNFLKKLKNLIRVTPSATGAPVQSGVSARSCLSNQYAHLCKYMQICTYTQICTCKYDRSAKLLEKSKTIQALTSPAIDHDLQQDVRDSQGGRRLCQSWAGSWLNYAEAEPPSLSSPVWPGGREPGGLGDETGSRRFPGSHLPEWRGPPTIQLQEVIIIIL